MLFFVLVCYFYKEILLFFLIRYYISLNSDLFYFIFTNVTEIFYVYFIIVNFINFQVFCWYYIFHVIVFLSPALFIDEHKYLNFFFKLFTFFLSLSFLLANYLLIPLIWNFFFNFQSLLPIHFEAKLSEYIYFYTNVYFFCFIYCQIFSALFLFLHDIYSKLSDIKIKKFRKLYYYILVVFSILISPSEIIILTSISLLLIYEFALFFLIYFFSLIKLI